MIIENKSTFGNTKAPEVLAHAQTVSNFFIDAIEQNDCNLKVLMGFYFEMDNTINGLHDLGEALLQEEKPEVPLVQRKGPSERRASPHELMITPTGVRETVRALNNQCFNCKLSLPKIHFDANFDFLYNKLTFQIEVYKDVFKIDFPRFDNYCHLAFSLQRTCIPDILRVIALLLGAYSAIMALNKIPKISLGVFVKAIIGKLMASVIANVKISIDMSQTGLPCVLSAIEEIARAIPTKDEIYNLPELSEEARRDIFKDYEPRSVYEESFKQKLKNKEITREEYDEAMEQWRVKNEPHRYYTEHLRTQTEAKLEETENQINEIFAKVSSTLERAQDDVNAFIKSLLGVIDFFECEDKRSGPDFSEVLQWLANLQEVLNFFSIIIGKWLQKVLDGALCKDNISEKEIHNLITQTNGKGVTLSVEDLADILEEFTGKEAQVSENGLGVMIYDKPTKKQLLPKLTLTGCNFHEFAEAHTLDNIIKRVVEDSKERQTTPQRTPQAPVEAPRNTPKPYEPAGSVIRVPEREDLYRPINVVIPPTPITPHVPLPRPMLERLQELTPRDGKAPLKTFPKDILQRISGKGVPLKHYNPSLVVPRKPNLEEDIANKDDKVLSVIEVGSALMENQKTFILKELDTIFDLIHVAPQSSSGQGLSTANTDTLDISEFLDERKDSSINGVRSLTDSRSPRASTPGTGTSSKHIECRTFEDVLSVLQNL